MEKKTETHILVGLTGQRYIFTRAAGCLLQAAVEAPSFGYKINFALEMGCEIASSRNRLAQMALDKEGVTHLLFVDYDMQFPPGTIKKLLDHDKDIVGASYNYRNEPPKPPKSTAIPEGVEGTIQPDDLPKVPFKCETLGTGLLLIKTSVLKKLKQPYFMWGFGANGELRYGEDTFFCQIAKRAGFEVWADPTLEVKHIGEQLF